MSIVICDYLQYVCLGFFSVIFVGNFQIQRFSLVSLFDKIVRLSRDLTIIYYSTFSCNVLSKWLKVLLQDRSINLGRAVYKPRTEFVKA